MRRSAAVAAAGALVVLVLLWAVADGHPVVRPQVERLAVLTVAIAVLAVVLAAGIRAHPEAAVTDLDRAPGPPPAPEDLPRELRRIAASVEAATAAGADGGARAVVHRIGRERLRARGLDPDDPGTARAAHDLTGEHLWVLVATPPDQPIGPVDLAAALHRLEAL
ncbi:hypothetical protein HC251_01045 [Iamia sp. SCSIO 61187]|uniref:hypothetical protein n=1 Tax=Iamia sp. SCSIO 61187 TaxID=2722752 RepID=UPI001C63416B|nr:hypothetical protein [Iamia sp. SCSIO 61187]QYG91157.1 hypothetical protein HC251_01045 [Iamia sp. SCSIO 61187]